MSNLILVRHGQSKFNLERRFTGFYDVELTSQGEAEARYAGELIKKLNIELEGYFTSNLKRASDSLDIILKILNKKNILSVRGKKFRGAHVHSIIKRKRMRDEKLEREYPEVRSDFYLDVYDKSILLSR